MTRVYRVIDGGDLKGNILMNPSDMELLNLSTLSVIIFKHELGYFGAGRVKKDYNVEPGTIKVDTHLLESSHIKHGDEVEIEKYEKEVIPVTRVNFVLIPHNPGTSAEELKARAEEKSDELKNLLDNKIVFDGMEISWPSLNSIVRIVTKQPKLGAYEVGLLTWEELTYSFSVKGMAEKFDAILLIDTSGSMQQKDLLVKNISPVIESLKDYARDDSSFQAFLNQFKEGTRVTRIMGAALAAQLYLQRKIERGFGERVAVVTFAREADELTFKPRGSSRLQPWVECKGEGAEIGIKVISRFIQEKCQSGEGLTDMAAALEKAAEIADQFDPLPDGKKLPVMILLLTDGLPTKGRNPIDVVKERFADRSDVVIYTLGIGNPEEIDEDLLREISQVTKGQYSLCA
ncbi:MAG: vWA domain-containing protein, partial [Candidatus Asgardarchaeia archaeon]